MRRSSSTIPFGYKLDEEDTTKLVEVPEELEVLNDILPLIKNQSLSLREGSLYISQKTGRSLSLMGLKKIAEKRAVG